MTKKKTTTKKPQLEVECLALAAVAKELDGALPKMGLTGLQYLLDIIEAELARRG